MGSVAAKAIADCAGRPLALRQVNFGQCEHRYPEYLAVNPISKTPAPLHSDG